MRHVISKLIRVTMIAALIANVTACAHRPATSREPSSAEIESLQNTQLVNMYKNTGATEAFLLGPPDQRGDRHPVCHINVTNQSRLVPSFIPLARTPDPRSYAIPECAREQLDQIADVALKTNLPQYAGAPLVLLGICVIDLGFSALATAATNKVTNRLVDRKPHLRHGKTLVQAGGIVAASAVTGYKTFKAMPKMGLIPAGAIGAICTSAGVYVGYLLVPPQ